MSGTPVLGAQLLRRTLHLVGEAGAETPLLVDSPAQVVEDPLGRALRPRQLRLEERVLLQLRSCGKVRNGPNHAEPHASVAN